MNVDILGLAVGMSYVMFASNAAWQQICVTDVLFVFEDFCSLLCFGF